MTFYEAAVAVLREAGRPLHYKKIAEIAVRERLLSHVGKTPEITMGARLAQEVKKPASETVLLSSRPGIYGLREDADPDAARETIRLREVPPEVDEDDDDDDADDETTDGTPVPGGERSPAPDEAEGVEDSEDNEDDDTGDDGDDDDDDDHADDSRGRRRRRRRGRRGGRTRRPDESEEAAATSAESPPSATPEPSTERRPAPTHQPRSTSSAPPAMVQGSDEALRAAGEFARAVVGILEDEGRSELSLRQLAGALNRRGFGAASKLSPAIVRRSLEDANERRAQHGWPPIFVEIRPDRWALATASGEILAASYAALEAWQNNHRTVLKNTLVERLESLDGSALASVVTLVLERLGHHDIVRHDRLGREHATLSATLTHGLTSSRVAIRIAQPGTTVTREDLMALRGSLHTYRADDAALVSISGFDADARTEAVVPNLPSIALIDAGTLASHLTDCGVGVSAFKVDVSCVDEAFFRDFQGES